MSKTILITGASKGFGRIWTEAFLQQGYQVAATARNIEPLTELVSKYGDSLLTFPLNVNNREDVFAAVEKVHDHFGKIDVLINNAGYALFGAIEEASEQEAKDQFQTNFFGALWMTQAVLPIMRAQKSGHIIQTSSILGLITLPFLGLYNASKFALEGFSETLAAEVKDFGINITLVEPNGYASDIWKNETHSQGIAAYDEIKKINSESGNSGSFGNIEATADAILQLVATENPPLRLLLGKVGLPFVKHHYAQRLSVWEEWAEVSEIAHGN
ncbi:SDR family NAD(P)-dependent oxidoreductase [Algoriphagus aestuariicola]|uniref:SDR family NAD(P)-dependent oxidoreductase n=1 Tax=Algoriphagus aestuariicola TaxID=1852016 RepID=A0ABS3BLY9_9BACT|nr:SDR family NAD(P)-dependent oxidoreductase [Algoriphagus aestuariicola]MBN7800323.1 SDR family NAD(P)-dependent oxidoreductase [Algoriphagus aestuariicola]